MSEETKVEQIKEAVTQPSVTKPAEGSKKWPTLSEGEIKAVEEAISKIK